MDQWCLAKQELAFDKGGEWAKSGTVQLELLQAMMGDNYFSKTPPKSTGREYFNIEWLKHYTQQLTYKFKPEDIQATLCELTAATIAKGINRYGFDHGDIFICGGGIHNDYLMERLQDNLSGRHVQSTAVLGADPDWVEAMAFAWLAYQTINHRPGNCPQVTGASRPTILGGIWQV